MDRLLTHPYGSSKGIKELHRTCSSQDKLVRLWSWLDEHLASWTCPLDTNLKQPLYSSQAINCSPINSCGKRTPNNVTSIAVMEVTSESSELLNGRRSYYTNNYLKQALYKRLFYMRVRYSNTSNILGILKVLTLSSEDSWPVSAGCL